MELKVLGYSAASIVVLFLLSKLMGNKQISQLSAFDYIIGISIGSVAGNMASADSFSKALECMAALVLYGFAAYLISKIVEKKNYLRKVISGRPIVVMDNGCIYRKNLLKARVDISELLTLCRKQGYFDISQIQTAIIENDGTLSILPKAAFKPATPFDMNLNVQQEKIMVVVVSDGHVLTENLKLLKRDEQWLNKKLKEQNLKPQEVFVAFCDGSQNVSAYRINNNKVEVDWFE